MREFALLCSALLCSATHTINLADTNAKAFSRSLRSSVSTRLDWTGSSRTQVTSGCFFATSSQSFPVEFEFEFARQSRSNWNAKLTQISGSFRSFVSLSFCVCTAMNLRQANWTLFGVFVFVSLLAIARRRRRQTNQITQTTNFCLPLLVSD